MAIPRKFTDCAVLIVQCLPAAVLSRSAEKVPKEAAQWGATCKSRPPWESPRRPTDSLWKGGMAALWGRGCAVAAATHDRTLSFVCNGSITWNLKECFMDLDKDLQARQEARCLAQKA